jgi:hypothetical protein
MSEDPPAVEQHRDLLALRDLGAGEWVTRQCQVRPARSGSVSARLTGTVVSVTPARAAHPLAKASADALRRATVTTEDPVVAVIVHGSLTFGDFVADRSDIDLLMVVERPLTKAQRSSVQRTVTAWCRRYPIDLRIVTRAIAAHPTDKPELEFYVGCHRDRIELASRCAEPDLLVEFSVVRAHGKSVIGPDAHTVVGIVPRAWLLDHSDRELARWQGLTGDQQNADLMLLTACRAWRFAVEGVHCGKSEAGRWALARDPSLAAIEGALRGRASREGAIREDGIARVLAIARGMIAAAAAAPGLHPKFPAKAVDSASRRQRAPTLSRQAPASVGRLKARRSGRRPTVKFDPDV